MIKYAIYRRGGDYKDCTEIEAKSQDEAFEKYVKKEGVSRGEFMVTEVSGISCWIFVAYEDNDNFLKDLK